MRTCTDQRIRTRKPEPTHAHTPRTHAHATLLRPPVGPQIVKASEPAFAALLGVTLYGKTVSQAKWLCLIPVIGGVCLASIKELDFSVAHTRLCLCAPMRDVPDLSLLVCPSANRKSASSYR
eukprot:2242141-Pleurochrysis_carterae.AAC.4